MKEPPGGEMGAVWNQLFGQRADLVSALLYGSGWDARYDFSGLSGTYFAVPQ
jgi:hypothetical protein